MRNIVIWRPAAVGCFVLVLALACGSSDAGFVGAGGLEGLGGSAGSTCDVAAVNACLDLQTCCREILISPVFFQSCNAVALQCNKERCLEVLAGYPRCEQLDL